MVREMPDGDNYHFKVKQIVAMAQRFAVKEIMAGAWHLAPGPGPGPGIQHVVSRILYPASRPWHLALALAVWPRGLRREAARRKAAGGATPAR